MEGNGLLEAHGTEQLTIRGLQDDASIPSSELPFLVTHWLANYQSKVPEEFIDRQEQDAIQQIHNAAAELASAFTSLGAYGTANVPNLKHRFGNNEAKNATYSDVARRYPQISRCHLESVIQSSASTAVAMDNVARRECGISDMFHAAREKKPNLGGGRRLNDEIDLTIDSKTRGAGVAPEVSSALQTPVLPGFRIGNHDTFKSFNPVSGATEMRRLGVPVESDYQYLCSMAARSMRQFLNLREKHHSEAAEINSLQWSLANQEKNKIDLLKQRKSLTTPRLAEIEQHILEGENNCVRVIAQLTANLVQRRAIHEKTTEQFRNTGMEAKTLYNRSLRIIQNYRDPFRPINSSSLPIFTTLVCGPRRNRHMLDIIRRQYAAGGSWGQAISQRRQIGLAISRKSASTSRKAVLATRLSHAVTINAHLTYPVYCLRFDRSGRYFITGADDCLVKLFILGAGPSALRSMSRERGKRQAFNYGANSRGAVLVSTLRGHAGVICDIDVSADNAFLATASDDGDVRIWGLRDGCPIAILRGHRGGANMVSWSTTTPYRLVTTGMDGLARIWDIREAALKRYASQVGARLDYKFRLTNTEKWTVNEETVGGSHVGIQERAELLSPLLVTASNNFESTEESHDPGPVVDPAANVALPVGPDNVVMNIVQNPVPLVGDMPLNIAENIVPGAFIANNNLDEGVRIVAKLQHGEPADAHAVGPGTRSRRKDVKVICVARCPLGGHFATGSDDGQCRIWLDEDDPCLSRGSHMFFRKSDPSDLPSTQNLLARLSGHMNAITDLRYSHAGDRILSASQKDGNARIWSWSVKKGVHTPRSPSGLSDMKQIVLKLTKVDAASQRSLPPRRRGAGPATTAGSAITCDVAVWTADDSKVVTSQCCPTTSSGVEITPGSQSILIWDSWTGSCLMGITSAHEMQCPVVVPHPVDPGIIISAGADGFAKVWDLEAGKCIFSHENDAAFFPEAQNQRGKKSGFLDGSFDHDGLTLILTDDNGRISVFDTLSNEAQNLAPGWMREQYFANDYYELFYDANGYCVEQGSQQPPHLAPRSARCNHSGEAWDEEASETFRYVNGPVPTLETETRAQRLSIWNKFANIPELSQFSSEYAKRTAIVMGEFDPSRTLIIQGSNGEIQSITSTLNHYAQGQLGITTTGGNVNIVTTLNRQQAQAPSRSLSSNYRWRDFEDLEREERSNVAADEPDSDDEEFVLNSNRRDNAVDLDDEELSGLEGMDSDDSTSFEYGGTPGNRRARSRRRQRRERNRIDARNLRRQQQQRVAPIRASSRTRVLPSEPDSDDDSIMEFMSTNNKPSGPFIHDYTVSGHLFRLPDSGSRIKRKWLRRLESASSYNGTKNYAPQVGDSVIYIARAHSETILSFPTLRAPWTDWPAGARWPTLRCKIKHIRFRFPYESCYRNRNVNSKCESIVAILTLEVTGIPEISEDREYPWPKPSFISRQTRSAAHEFEVSMFVSELQDFIIPEKLFRWRIESLENAVRANKNNFSEIPLACYLAPELVGADEDSTMVPYFAKLVGLLEESSETQAHLRGSGFQLLEIVWDDGGLSEYVSPWEVSLRDRIYDVPQPPRLSHHEKRLIRAGLEKAERSPTVKGFFMSPVDEARYSDYHSRVEVSMDFSFIEQRLSSDYYATAASVLADIQLVRDNCRKYNSEDAEISIAISSVVSRFEGDLRTSLGPELISLSDEGPIQSNSQIGSTLVTSESPGNRQTRSLRSLSNPRSSLEQLPSPSTNVNLRTESLSTSRTLRIRMPQSSRNETPELGRVTRNRTHEQSTTTGTRTRHNGRNCNSYLERVPSIEEEGINTIVSRGPRPVRFSIPRQSQVLDEGETMQQSQRPSRARHHVNLVEHELGTRRSFRGSSNPRRLHDESELGTTYQSDDQPEVDAILKDNSGSDIEVPHHSARGKSLRRNTQGESDSEEEQSDEDGDNLDDEASKDEIESESESEPDESDDDDVEPPTKRGTARRSSRSTNQRGKITEPKPAMPSPQRRSSRKTFASSPEYVEEKISSDEVEEESDHDKRQKRNPNRQSAAKKESTTRSQPPRKRAKKGRI